MGLQTMLVQSLELRLPDRFFFPTIWLLKTLTDSNVLAWPFCYPVPTSIDIPLSHMQCPLHLCVSKARWTGRMTSLSASYFKESVWLWH